MADKDPIKNEDFADVNDEEISGRADEEADDEFEDSDDLDEEEDEDEGDM